MKTISALLFSLAIGTSCMAAPVQIERSPILGDDIVEALDLNIQKFKVTFDAPKKIKIEFMGMQGNKQIIEVKGVSDVATLRISWPKPTNNLPIVKVDFKLTTGTGDGIVSAFSMDASKYWGTTTRAVGNDFVLVGLDEKDMNDSKVDSDHPLFRFRIITSK